MRRIVVLVSFALAACGGASAASRSPEDAPAEPAARPVATRAAAGVGEPPPRGAERATEPREEARSEAATAAGDGAGGATAVPLPPTQPIDRWRAPPAGSFRMVGHVVDPASGRVYVGEPLSGRATAPDRRPAPRRRGGGTDLSASPRSSSRPVASAGRTARRARPSGW